MKDIPKYVFYAICVGLIAYGFHAGWFKTLGGKFSTDSIEFKVK